MPSTLSNAEAWPSLPLEAWSDTCATLHMWTPDCWQDSSSAESVDQPFLARDLVRDDQGPYDEPHSLRKQDIPNRLRLHQSPS